MARARLGGLIETSPRRGRALGASLNAHHAEGGRPRSRDLSFHTDFERGFIRAETIAYDDYIACKGEAGARDAGKLRLEGRDYVLREGDLLYFRFNV